LQEGRASKRDEEADLRPARTLRALEEQGGAARATREGVYIAEFMQGPIKHAVPPLKTNKTPK
jgi:hypothetical protein